jgi:hypothetical protein
MTPSGMSRALLRGFVHQATCSRDQLLCAVQPYALYYLLCLGLSDAIECGWGIEAEVLRGFVRYVGIGAKAAHIDRVESQQARVRGLVERRVHDGLPTLGEPPSSTNMLLRTAVGLVTPMVPVPTTPAGNVPVWAYTAVPQSATAAETAPNMVERLPYVRIVSYRILSGRGEKGSGDGEGQPSFGYPTAEPTLAPRPPPCRAASDSHVVLFTSTSSSFPASASRSMDLVDMASEVINRAPGPWFNSGIMKGVGK